MLMHVMARLVTVNKVRLRSAAETPSGDVRRGQTRGLGHRFVTDNQEQHVPSHDTEEWQSLNDLHPKSGPGTTGPPSIPAANGDERHHGMRSRAEVWQSVLYCATNTVQSTSTCSCKQPGSVCGSG